MKGTHQDSNVLHAKAASIESSQLNPCPDRKNCVCSQDRSPSHTIKPLNGLGRVQSAFLLLITILKQTNRCHVKTTTSTYLHAEFRTRWLGFIDDVEFLLSTSEDVIHVRSASRVGFWDLGVNRRRIETIRRKLQKSLNSDPD